MHRKQFSQSEIEQIEHLIERKLNASDTEQKAIRNGIRSIGFYWSDFHPRDEFPKVTYNVENFKKLIRDGHISIIGGQKIMKNVKQEDKPSKDLAISSDDNDKQTNNDFKESLSPWVGDNPKVLILGTMPGDKSLELQAYYCNPNNSFWKLMFEIFGECDECNMTKKEYITSKGIALWDCLASGVTKGSMDSGYDESTLKGSDIQSLLDEYPTIHTIVLNGLTKTVEYFHQYCEIKSNVEVVELPSTASYISFEEKLKQWNRVKELIQ